MCGICFFPCRDKRVMNAYKNKWMASLMVMCAMLTMQCEEDTTVLPDIGIISPEDRSVFRVGEPITISAMVTRENVKIARMDFYVGTAKLGEDAIAPYEWTWGDAEAGNYTLSVTSVNEDGLESGSASITIDVTEAQ